MDWLVRQADLAVGGVGYWRFLSGRSLLAVLLPLPVFVFIVYGPSLLSPGGGPTWRGVLPALLCGAAIGAHVLYCLKAKGHWMAWLDLALVAALAGAVFVLGDATTPEASGAIYRHFYAPLAVLAMLVAVAVSRVLLATALFKLEYPTAFAEQFRPEIVVDRIKPVPFSAWDVVRAFVVSMVGTPLHVLTPVSLFVLVSAPDHLRASSAVAAAVSLILFAASNYDPEHDAFVGFVRRVLLSGGALFVSLGALAFAAMRMLGIGYVTTVLDASSRWTILSYVVSAYCLCWLFDFHVHQALLNYVLACVGGLRTAGSRSDVSFRLRRHGAGRLLLVVRGGGATKRRVFEPHALLQRIADTSVPSVRSALVAQISVLDSRRTAFFALTSMVFVAALTVAGVWAHTRPPIPGLAARQVQPNEPEAGLYDLARRLRAHGDGRPVLMLAASGGGTRAALYTAAVLHGLQRLGRLDDLVAGSGVSGGSAALAYFAAFRPSLIAGDPRAWSTMLDTLSAPYIEDVLAGAGSWRIVAGERLGQLLTESFDRWFERAGRRDGVGRRRTLREVQDLGLIFNTALCGNPPQTKAGEERPARKRSLRADGAGGNLLITNLSSRFTQGSEGQRGWDLDMRLEVIRDVDVPLVAAASLSANFPPVFPNAAVDISGPGDKQRFWVTDGGAVENRGMIPLLLAAADALEALRVQANGAAIPLAPVRFIVAEASAFDPDYRSDRGLGAKFGASTQIANLLIRELLARVAAAHEAVTQQKNPDAVRIIYLAMPDALRASGTFGTHWMMPPLIPFGGQVSDTEEETIELEGETVKRLIDALFMDDSRRADLKVPRDKVWARINPDPRELLLRGIR